MNKQIKFEKLRTAYIEVKAFLENESGEKIHSLNTRIEEDLGLTGDDNYYLLAKFVDKFKLQYDQFDYEKHFHTEQEFTDQNTTFLNFLIFLFWLPLKILELISFNQLKIEKPKFFKYGDRKILDLSFREILIWYIEGKYIENNPIRYSL